MVRGVGSVRLSPDFARSVALTSAANPPVEAAPAMICATVVMHAGHIGLLLSVHI
jgi:hypothetical protein